jgi:hypothetical protein
MISSDNISNCAKGRYEHCCRWMANQTEFQALRFYRKQPKKKKKNSKSKTNSNSLIKFNTHVRSSTSRGQGPASITAWIFSLVPSERYDSAQHASVRTSSSFECIRRSRAGIAGFVCALRFKRTSRTHFENEKKMH